MTSAALPFVTLGILLFSWVLFGLAVALRPRGAAPAVRARDRRSLLAILVQGLGFGLVWGVRRPFGASFLPLGDLGPLFLFLVTGALALSAAALAVAAVRTLGKQWSLTAQVVEAHALIITGPYAVVRHPIYTAMFGLLLATGMTLSSWQALGIGAACFIGGTLWRIRMEERLLRQAFGAAYDRYAANVPAFLPWLRAG